MAARLALTVLQLKIDAILVVLEEMADSIPTTPDLSDLDNAIMYCRHLSKHLQFQIDQEVA